MISSPRSDRWLVLVAAVVWRWLSWWRAVAARRSRLPPAPRPTAITGGSARPWTVYQPAAVRGRVPTVVYIHGGGWVSGNSSLPAGSVEADVEEQLVHRGWVFISISYRLAPTFRWPAQLVDAKCAIRYVRANAGALHVEPLADRRHGGQCRGASGQHGRADRQHDLVRGGGPSRRVQRSGRRRRRIRTDQSHLAGPGRRQRSAPSGQGDLRRARSVADHPRWWRPVR